MTMMNESGHREIGSLGHRIIEAPGKKDCMHLSVAVIATWRSGHVIKRRRKCLVCGERFSTEEKLPAAIKKTCEIVM